MIDVALTETPVQEPQRIRGLEMPWNRVMGSLEGPASAAKALGPWHPQEFMAECVETVPEAGGMMTFVFRRCDGAPLAFRAGQYVNIAFPVNGEDQEPVDRSYSLSSSPTEPWTFSVTVKKDAGGLVSPWVHENVRPGTVLDMLGPVGAFHLPDADRRARYLFLAAGAGITPIMSMLRTIHDLPGTADVVVLYHGAEAGGFAFHKELAYIASVDSRVKVFYALGDRGLPEEWEGFKGRLSAAMIDEVAPDANGRQVYACGPEGYLNTATELLKKVGVDDTSIYMEFFSGDRQTLLEYQAELALAADIAEEIAEEIADSAEDYYESQPAAFGMYEPGYDEDGTLQATGMPLEAVDPDAPAAETTGTTPETSAPDASNFDTVGTGSLTLSFMRTGINVRIDPELPILEVAQRAGVRIGANCKEGMCGSCKVVKLSGEVDMNHQGGIRKREIDAGKFLPCCSTARTDMVIDA
ncbi:Oxidoreductase FAD-binding domain protein [Pseudarthrobacter chlorophenolicus A6]|uniref:Oxidoreductase FAD-binding domain protein n=1 Tax=Pseudarthrobacter chlorophenolicus (strain ATCC 700700 / DSM 12829 / CIP 107037 / JCM 12360 / KCTC 9906 / NCIMB 13794 / A6) TaxID=452863 RepID=B8H743_PSECP|nr:ferredoxin reductase [Pseudarthrobacter chlorophenolicus]ACL41645.1 Oxidoreductase FAD-binding domain protein [Pseudarthrobacter chlorophenolicus A6]SDQ60714.1 Ferredoxin-NADP reductase [Pseudarthrobacter chlorophenolicus]